MILTVCDGGCGTQFQERDERVAQWITLTPRTGLGDQKQVIPMGTQHFCPMCWERVERAMHPVRHSSSTRALDDHTGPGGLRRMDLG